MSRNSAFSYLLWKFVLRQPRFRRLVTNALIRDRNEWIRVLGVDLYINRRKEIGYWRASRQQHGNAMFRDEIPTLIRLSAFVGGSSTFVDCGANVGLFTVSMLPFRRVFPEMGFLAYEPNPDTFARLIKALDGTGVTIENVALSNENGFVEMASAATSGAFGVPGGSFQLQNELMRVPCKRLDSCAIPGAKIFLKIDVEGHELEVLEGATGLFQEDRVFAVFIDGAAKEVECLAFLSTRGFSIFNAHDLKSYRLGDFRVLALKSDRDRLAR